LTLDDVVEAAIACLTEGGSKALGINNVARVLGIRPPSLYHHVASNEDLLQRVAIEGWRRLGAAMAERPSAPDPRASIQALAKAFRRFVSDHPSLYEVMSGTPLTDVPEFEPIASAIMQDFARVLATYGLQGDEVVHAVRMMRASLHGFVLLEQTGQFGMPQSIEESFDWLIAHLDLSLERSAARL
jgi:AcrR family transcriptional regulator